MKEYYEAVRKFHRKYKMKGTNNEDMQFRLNLMTEELGELAAAVTKGKTRAEFIEENIDILRLTIGNLISCKISLKEFDKAFWKKHEKVMNRESRNINGKIRISEFR